jgi:magnesium transporter
MLTRHQHGSVTWIDTESPTHEEIRALMEEFRIDPLIADELSAPSLRSKVDARHDHFYTVLHFPALTSEKHRVDGRAIELDFIVGKDWIITTRYGILDPLHRFSQVFEVDTVLNKQNMGEHAGFVFFYMLSDIYRYLSDELAHTGIRLDSVEEQIFDGFEREMVEELSFISRDLLNYSEALANHGSVLRSLEQPSVTLFGYQYALHMRRIVGDYELLAATVVNHRESLVELRRTNDSLLTTKQNEIMKLFTILAFVTFPLTLFSSLFGMNTQVTPIIGSENDFWVIVGIMATITIGFFLFFKYKNWL